jgi:hypothetical protein
MVTPRVLIAFFVKKEKKMTRGKKTEEGRMHCACVEALISTTIARNIFNAVSIYLLGPSLDPPPSALSTLYVKDFSFKS